MSKKPPQAPGSPAAPPTKRRSTRSTKGTQGKSRPTAAKPAAKPGAPGAPPPSRKRKIESTPSAEPSKAAAPDNVLPFKRPPQEPPKPTKGAPRLPPDEVVKIHAGLVKDAFGDSAFDERGNLLTSASDRSRARKLGKAGKPQPPYSRELTDLILLRIACGELLNTICEEPGMPLAATFRYWVISDVDGLAERHARAREVWAHYHADWIVEASDKPCISTRIKTGSQGIEVITADSIERTKLQIDTRKFLLSAVASKFYGQHLQVGGELTLNLVARLKALAAIEVSPHAAVPMLPAA